MRFSGGSHFILKIDSLIQNNTNITFEVLYNVRKDKYVSLIYTPAQSSLLYNNISVPVFT